MCYWLLDRLVGRLGGLARHIYMRVNGQAVTRTGTNIYMVIQESNTRNYGNTRLAKKWWVLLLYLEVLYLYLYGNTRNYGNTRLV